MSIRQALWCKVGTSNFTEEKVLDTRLGPVDRIQLGYYEGLYMISSDVNFDSTNDGKLEVAVYVEGDPLSI